MAIVTAETLAELDGIDALANSIAKRERPVVRPRLPKLKASEMPDAPGWRILVLPPAIPAETEGGIALVDGTRAGMRAMDRVGMVIAIGPLAWSEKRGYPKGYREREIGDWVGFSENAGVDHWINDEDGNLVKIKSLQESDFTMLPKTAESCTVVM